ncbi:TENA/THI family protein [Schizosaccharomyces cryophilus OY26]|uniref:TENA/THI family protein n=1 Tax=Schizosaccharomyces cryophilus (strain OY26 / ATCC MYA-4695 / CBS 11777 / NBRC 106824 / NRRL Y48691) TaxID=653667 RepID=S9X940_SCHCR|nr:TENA/THI family protein [Schizosaccharomyces cryophilus OY26]EPY53717.1 TENA/THI family protein [Schizosaccharomyces cryophilus OY26]
MFSTCITVAGSDCSGGAGIQADLKVFTAHSVYGMSAITAITSQNTIGVNGVHLIPAPFVEKQIDACMLDVKCDVMKTGMLFNPAILKVAIDMIDRYKLKTVVVDPLIATRKGVLLVLPSYLDLFIKELIPRAAILTPNIAEATILLKHMTQETIEIHHVDDVKILGARLVASGCKNVIIRCDGIPFDTDFSVCKDSSMPSSWYVYVLCTSEGQLTVPQKWLSTKTAKGTSCALSSAIAANLANHVDLPNAVKRSVAYTQHALESSFHLGRGANSLDYSSSFSYLPFEQGEIVSLSVSELQKYLVLKYHMLVNNAQAAGMTAFSSSNIAAIERSAKIIQVIKEENEIHLEICKQYGLSPEQFVDRKPAFVNSHAGFINDVGQREGVLGIQVAMLPFPIIIQDVFTTMDISQPGPFNPFIAHCKDSVTNQHLNSLLDNLESEASTLIPEKVQMLIRILEQSLSLEKIALDITLDNETTVF